MYRLKVVTLVWEKKMLRIFNRTNPNRVHLSEQLWIILLHSLQALKHGSHMGLTQQKGIT